MKTFGGRLRALRDSRNWSQEKLGFELGVTKATISKWESDKLKPGLDTLLKIKRLFANQAISLDFLGDDRTPRQQPAAASRMMESVGAQEGDPRTVRSPTELQLLVWFRGLSRKRQQALLKLLFDEG